jgi:hypothetical protein
MKTYRSFASTRILFSTLTLATTLGPLACSLSIDDEQPQQGNVSEDAADLSAASKKTKVRPAIAEFRGGTSSQTSTVTVGVSTVSVSASTGTSGSATSGSATSGGGTGGYGGSGSTGSGKGSISGSTTVSGTTSVTTATSGGGGTGGYGGTGGVDSATSVTTSVTTATSGGGGTGGVDSATSVTSGGYTTSGTSGPSGSGGSGGVDSATSGTSGGYTSSGSSGTGSIPGGNDPDTLDLTITKGAPVCNGDNSVAPCDDWRVNISIPVALQHPGTIPLSSLALNSSFFFTSPPDGSGSCVGGSGGGGSFIKGSIEILSIDAEKVVFKLKNEFNADGKYVAEVCAPPPPPPPPPPAGPTSVIALLESEVVPEPPTGGSSSVSSSSSASATSGGGTVVDPDSLRLILSDNPLVCDHPLAPVGCPGWKISIRIPPALQHPGIIPLSSPELSSFGSANFQSEGSTTCSFGGGTFWDGTIEIVSIDATQVTFRLADTQKWMVNADGEYTAPRCFTP